MGDGLMWMLPPIYILAPIQILATKFEGNMSNEFLTVGICFVFAWMGIWIGHWFPWRKLPWKNGKDLTRLEAYGYGVLWIAGLPSIALLLRGDIFAACLLLAVTLSAGLATIIAYGIDGWIDAKHEAADERDRANYAGTGHPFQTD